MKAPLILEIHEVMKGADMVIFDRPFSITLGGIRTKDNLSEAFNDFHFASMFTPAGNLVSAIIEGTTDAGLYYRKNPLNVDGTAIIKHGVQHRGAYTYMEEGGHRGQEAFRQTGDMEYWRDADRDKYLEFDGESFVDNFATNGHDMGSRENVGKNSAGCWGAHNTNMEILYHLAKVQIKNGVGAGLSYAMLHENMF